MNPDRSSSGEWASKIQIARHLEYCGSRRSGGSLNQHDKTRIEISNRLDKLNSPDLACMQQT
jgi:hypothetical protein